jgi:hypothetical protein
MTMNPERLAMATARPAGDQRCSTLHEQEESAGIMKAKGAMPREPGTRLAAS